MTKPRITFNRVLADLYGFGWIIRDSATQRLAAGEDPADALSRFREKYAVETNAIHQKNEVA